MDDIEIGDVLAELRALRERVAVLEGPGGETPADVESPPEDRSTRRGMLRLAGAAVVGGAAASLVASQPAAATTGNLVYGLGTNNAGDEATGLTSSVASETLRIINTSGEESSSGVQARATGGGTGVTGLVTSPTAVGYAVFGNVGGPLGIGLVAAGGAAHALLIPYSGSVAPDSNTHLLGELVSNNGGIFCCVATGTPGTWRKIAGPATAGAFHAITPTRVYDSRAAIPLPGMISTGGNRTISVADGRDGSGAVTTADLVPAGATAVAANITVTGTVGKGYLAINPGGNLVEGASTINWSAAGLTIANGVSLTLNASRQLTVICNGGGGSTHFIVDIAGYYL